MIWNLTVDGDVKDADKPNRKSDVDETLLRDIAAGDKTAFRRFYDAAKDAIYGYCLVVLKNEEDAADVMQDSFLKVFHSAHTYEPMGKPMAWVMTITRNLCLMKLRERKRKATVSMDEVAERAVPDHAEHTIDSMILNKAMGELDEAERQIIVLYALTGMKHREIADICDMGLSTVISKYRRGLKKLNKIMLEMGVSN